MSDSETKSDKTRLQRLVRAGVPLLRGTVANVTSAAVGALLGDPLAAAAVGGATGTVFSTTLAKVGAEIEQRLLSPRETARVGAVLALGAAAVRERLDQGEQLRADGFFDSGNDGRSSADEVIESVLLRSQREPEEKKLPYMAHLLASVAFDDQIGVEMTHQLSKVAERLTYRQLCILTLVNNKEAYELRGHQLPQEKAQICEALIIADPGSP